MGCEIICDGCGKRAPAIYANWSWHKPADWYERSDKDGPQTACSRRCIDSISENTGKTGMVLPV